MHIRITNDRYLLDFGELKRIKFGSCQFRDSAAWTRTIFTLDAQPNGAAGLSGNGASLLYDFAASALRIGDADGDNVADGDLPRGDQKAQICV